MRIHLLEPFFGGSHREWALGYQQHSRHEVALHTLPGSYWKWRMWGGAVALARKYREGLPLPDLWLATDMLDLATFLGLVRDLPGAARVPVVAYFHENQLTYPWSPADDDVAAGRELQYAFINFTTALAADLLCFNSAFHRDSFLGGLPGMLRRFPDRRQRDLVPSLWDKARVLPVGLELRALDARTDVVRPEGPPIVLWNHRWEFDKGPDLFFRALMALADEGVPFRLVVLGESFARSPAVFAEAREKLADRILHWGYAPDRAEYARWLWRADILPVTSLHDFFGISVVEAIWCRCWPLLPRRLAYPEHLPGPAFDGHFYDADEAFLPALRRLLTSWRPEWCAQTEACRAAVARYDWSVQAPACDQLLEELVSAGTTRR